jgi:CheY-like chemotaxis protein
MAKILVAEDEPGIREIIKRYITLFKHEPHLVTNGQEAFDYLQSNQADALITDEQMPKMRGYELIKTLRANNYNLPIILMSGTANYKEAKEAGANMFIQKPISISDFKSALDELLKE